MAAAVFFVITWCRGDGRYHWTITHSIHRRAFLKVGSFSVLGTLTTGCAAQAGKRVGFLVGPAQHPPGTHEEKAGARLMAHCLEHAQNVSGYKAQIHYEWPGAEALEGLDNLVCIGDSFPPQRWEGTAEILEALGALMKRGCGITCIHFGLGLKGGDVSDNGDHPLLHWIGGYSAARCKHHQSKFEIFENAVIAPAAGEHPTQRGWKEFTIHEEPYYNNYFGPEGNHMLPGVFALAVSFLPPQAPRREVVAWGIERGDGGRGAGICLPHFYKNWLNEDLRSFIMNTIVWTAKGDVPAEGVRTAKPDLAAFDPVSIEPQTWPVNPKPEPESQTADKPVAAS